jgi:DNA polymerase III epsilon subunit-like protein
VTVAFVDTETTGLDPERHEIWEVGLILPDGSEHEWTLPVDLARADPKSLAMNGYHERHGGWDYDIVETAEIKRGFANTFATLTRGLHLAGANVSFDADRLWRLLRANHQCPMWHYHLIDVEVLAVGKIAQLHPRDVPEALAVRTPPWKHTDLVRALGIDPDSFDRHSAIGDARMAKATYEAVMGS